MSQIQQEARTADEAMLHVQQIGKYKVTPLSFGKMAAISQPLSKLVKRVAEVNPDNDYSVSGMLETGLVLMPELLPIMAIMLDATEEELQALDSTTGITLLTALITTNINIFLDFFRLAASLSPSQMANAAQA